MVSRPIAYGAYLPTPSRFEHFNYFWPRSIDIRLRFRDVRYLLKEDTTATSFILKRGHIKILNISIEITQRTLRGSSFAFEGEGRLVVIVGIEWLARHRTLLIKECQECHSWNACNSKTAENSKRAFKTDNSSISAMWPTDGFSHSMQN